MNYHSLAPLNTPNEQQVSSLHRNAQNVHDPINASIAISPFLFTITREWRGKRAQDTLCVEKRKTLFIFVSFVMHTSTPRPSFVLEKSKQHWVYFAEKKTEKQVRPASGENKPVESRNKDEEQKPLSQQSVNLVSLSV